MLVTPLMVVAHHSIALIVAATEAGSDQVRILVLLPLAKLDRISSLRIFIWLGTVPLTIKCLKYGWKILVQP